jgi:hypothetical protein
MGVRVIRDRRRQLKAQFRAACDELLGEAAGRTVTRARANAAKDSGELAGSIWRQHPKQLHWRVIVRAPHGWFIEFGTALMTARPFLLPAYRLAKAWLRRRLKKAGSS